LKGCFKIAFKGCFKVVNGLFNVVLSVLKVCLGCSMLINHLFNVLFSLRYVFYVVL